MPDILMIVLIGLAGLLALVLGFIFCPFGALFWFLLAKNAEDAREQKAYEEFMLYGPFGREIYEAQQRYDESRREVELMVSLIDWRLGGY